MSDEVKLSRPIRGRGKSMVAANFAEIEARLLAKAASDLTWNTQPKGALFSMTRGWPVASHKSGSLAAVIESEVSFTPKRAADGTGGPLTVKVAVPCHSPAMKQRHGAFRWIELSTKPQTLDEAKVLATMWFVVRPEDVR